VRGGGPRHETDGARVFTGNLCLTRNASLMDPVQVRKSARSPPHRGRTRERGDGITDIAPRGRELPRRGAAEHPPVWDFFNARGMATPDGDIEAFALLPRCLTLAPRGPMNELSPTGRPNGK